MTIIDRYLFRTVLASALLVLLVLLALELLFTLIGELEGVGDRAGYGALQVAQYLLFSVPGFVYQSVPMALLVGGLLGVGGLAAANELVAMRAAGRSPLRVATGALLAALLLGLGALAIGEFLAPHGDRLARQLRADADGVGAVQTADGGFWARDGDQIVRVGALLGDGTLADVTLFALAEDGTLRQVFAAARGRFDSGRWLLDEVVTTRFDAAALSAGQRGRLYWDSELRPATLRLLNAEPESLALRDLDGYIAYLERNGLDAREYRLAFWHKLLSPLTTVAVLLVGLPFAFGRSRVAGAGQRLLIGVLLGLGFFLLNRLLGSWVLLTGLPPLLGAALPPLLFLCGGLIPLQRLR